MRKQLYFCLKYAYQYIERVRVTNTSIKSNEDKILKDVVKQLMSIACPDKIPF